VAGNWTSQKLTSGINPSNGEMPRGPSHGKPRGTQSLVEVAVYLKSDPEAS
jgi:hypothetical protein